MDYSALDHADTLSVIICNYNRAACLPVLVAAIVQSDANIREIIIVDDASSDGADDIYDALCKPNQPCHVRILRHAENQGASASRNHGIREAKGNILAFIDSDVSLTPDILPALCRAIRSGADGAFPTGIFPDGVPYHPTDDLSRSCCLNSALFVIRKDVLSRFDEWFDENMPIYGEDPDFFLRAHAFGVRMQHEESAVIEHPRRRFHTGKEFYMAYRNTLYMALKLRGIIPYRHPWHLVVAVQSLRFLVTACTGRWLDGLRLTDGRMLVGRRDMFRLYIDAIRWVIGQSGELKIKRKALRACIRAATS